MKFALASVLLLAALNLSQSVEANTLEPRAKKCTQSTQCNVSLKHFCNRGYCSKAKADGESCYKNVGCLSNVCDTGTGKFASTNARPLNAACKASTQCQSGYCGWSTCRAPVKNGQYCYKDVGCTSKKCNKQTNKCVKSGTSSTTTAPSSMVTLTSTKAVTSSTATATRSTSAAATSSSATVGTSTSSVDPISSTATVATSSTTATTAAATTATVSTTSADTVATTSTATLVPIEATTFAIAKAPAPTTAIPANGDFSNGQLSPFRTSAVVGEGSKISIEEIDGDYVAAVTVGSGGSVSLTREVRQPSLGKRQNPDRWFIEFAVALAEFGKGPEGEEYGSCHANVTVGGQTYLLQDWVYDYAISGAYGERAAAWYHPNQKWLTGPTDATITLGCVRGMTGKFYLDNVNIGPYLHWYPPYVLNDPDFESGTLSPEWYSAGAVSSTIGIKNEPGLAQSGEHYMEATADGWWSSWSYTLTDDPPYYREEADEDPGRQDLTWELWYNLVSMESTNGDDSARDGCYFSATADQEEHYLGTTKDGSQYMQVNDPNLTLPSGWKKLNLAMPVDRAKLDFWFWCKKGVKATVRLDNLSLSIPRNETAS